MERLSGKFRIPYRFRVPLFVFFILLSITFFQEFFIIERGKMAVSEFESEHVVSGHEVYANELKYAEIYGVPELEQDVLDTISGDKDVLFSRIVSENGVILGSTIDGEEGSAVESLYIPTRKTVVVDSVFQGASVKLVITPIFEDKALITGFSEERLIAVWESAALNAFVFSMLLVSIGTLFSQIVTHRMTEQVGELVKGMKGLRSGDVQDNVPIVSNDELGDLATLFNLLKVELRKSKKFWPSPKVRGEEVDMETKKLEHKVEELEKFRKIAIGQEEKIRELRGIIDELEFPGKRKEEEAKE